MQYIVAAIFSITHSLIAIMLYLIVCCDGVWFTKLLFAILFILYCVCTAFTAISLVKMVES